MTNLEKKALRVIEALVSDDLCMGIELHPDRPLNQDDIDLINRKFGAIYRYAHSVRDTALCYGSHGDWRQELDRVYKRMRRRGLVPLLRPKRTEELFKEG